MSTMKWLWMNYSRGAFQHEYDHLDGRLIVDYIKEEDQKKYSAKLAKIQAANKENS